MGIGLFRTQATLPTIPLINLTNEDPSTWVSFTEGTTRNVSYLVIPLAEIAFIPTIYIRLFAEITTTLQNIELTARIFDKIGEKSLLVSTPSLQNTGVGGRISFMFPFTNSSGNQSQANPVGSSLLDTNIQNAISACYPSSSTGTGANNRTIIAANSLTMLSLSRDAFAVITYTQANTIALEWLPLNITITGNNN